MEQAWISQLREIFFTEDMNKLDVLGAIALKGQHIPKRLFKYRECKETSLLGLRGDTLWCASADQFNDPYDCALTCDPYRDMNYAAALAVNSEGLSQADKEQIIQADDPLRVHVDFMYRDSPDKSSADRIYAVLKQMESFQREEIVKGLCDAIRKKHRICALSERVDSILMWGHYAKSHTGFAIEYDFTPSESKWDVSRYLWPVIYSDKLYDVSYIFNNIKDDNHGFNNLFDVVASLHKGIDWAYEHEWRIIIPDGDVNRPGSYKVPKATAIHLGAKIDEADRLKLIKEAQMKGIKVYQMQLAQHEFRLESVLI